MEISSGGILSGGDYVLDSEVSYVERI